MNQEEKSPQIRFDTKTDSVHINFRGKELTRFPQLDKILNFQSILLQYNKISSFETLPECPNMRKLYLDNNIINSFEKAKKQPKLSTISLIENPISKNSLLGIMAYIVFGQRIRCVNGDFLSIDDIKMAQRLEPIIRHFLIDGYLLISLKPITLQHFKTQEIIELNIPQRKNSVSPRKPGNLSVNSPFSERKRSKHISPRIPKKNGSPLPDPRNLPARPNTPKPNLNNQQKSNEIPKKSKSFMNAPPLIKVENTESSDDSPSLPPLKENNLEKKSEEIPLFIPNQNLNQIHKESQQTHQQRKSRSRQTPKLKQADPLATPNKGEEEENEERFVQKGPISPKNLVEFGNAKSNGIKISPSVITAGQLLLEPVKYESSYYSMSDHSFSDDAKFIPEENKETDKKKKKNKKKKRNKNKKSDEEIELFNQHENKPELPPELSFTIPDATGNELQTLILHDSGDLNPKHSPMFLFKENQQRQDNRSYIDNASLMSFSVDKMSASPRRVPPPKLNLSPINTDYSETIEDSRDLGTEDLHEIFFRQHMNVITTPQDADDFVYNFRRKKKTQLKQY